MNHLEQLTSEWLQYRGYFVRVSVPVGPRVNGGFEGELDVVALHPATEHLLHVECSLDSETIAKRELKFGLKFERGRKYVRDVFRGLALPEHLDQVALLQYSGARKRDVAGARLVTVKESVREIGEGLKGTKPSSKAVSSNLPLLRTIQLCADAKLDLSSSYRVVPKRDAELGYGMAAEP